ncbi:unnamed protein product [Linum trigynum]|uniref:Reverse transcriptase domain-containing protein n=1 Tax=Linum trigynum TaxID=586398 RepID=A0AAV2CWY8_9ROSI
MPLILGRPFLATTKDLIDVNEGTLILRDVEEKITLGIESKPRSEDVKEVESNDKNASGGEPFKMNPTITVIPCGDVKQEIKESITPKEIRRRTWRERMNRIIALKKEEDNAKVIGQEGHPMDLSWEATSLTVRSWWIHSRWFHILKHYRFATSR